MKPIKKYTFLYFFETWFISLVLLVFITWSIINYIFDFNIDYHNFIENKISRTLNDLKGSLLSIAAIFIGVYVTVFTLLGSIKVDSIFAFLNEHTFRKLINFIRNAFIASFSYLVLIMVLEIIYPNSENVTYPLVILNAAIVIYMFLTALRFGIILYVAFNKDLKDLQQSIMKHRKEKRKVDSLQFRVEKFLDEFEREQIEKQNEQISKIIKNDQNKE